MNPRTSSDLDGSTEQVLADLGHVLAAGSDVPAVAMAALSAAVAISGAAGGEVVTVDDATTMVPRATLGGPRGGAPAVTTELPGPDGALGRITLWGDPAPAHPAVPVIAAQLGLAVRAMMNEREAVRRRDHTRRLAHAVRALRDVHPTEQAVLALLREAQAMTTSAASALITGLPGDPGPVVSLGLDPVLEPALAGLMTADAAVVLDAGQAFTAGLPGGSPLAAVAGGYAAVPVGGPVERIGTLVVLTAAPSGLSPDLLDPLLGLADHATTALGAAALRERLRDLATVDATTRYFNERYFATRLEQEAHRALRIGDTLSLLIVRIEEFDQLRASAGAGAADKAVAALAEFMVPRLRATDIGCRTAPDEFALILPGAAGLDAFLIGERIRSGFGAEAALGWGVTLSVGVATFPEPAGTADQLDAFAHAAAEFARRNGSDRVFLYDREIAAGIDAADQRERQNAETLLTTISSLAAAIDERHPTTRLHSQNVARFAAMLAGELGLPADHVENVRLAGLLHDVGKVGVTDELLVRPGPLTLAEWKEMRQHPDMAHRMLSGTRLDGVPDWVRAHQERPDGAGYPRGLSGEQIPLEAGIVAVANALDTMIHDRPYRPAHPLEHAVDEITRGAGTQFMPAVVDALNAIVARGDVLGSDHPDPA